MQFVGDDRSGLDPHYLAVDPNGNLTFGTCNYNGAQSQMQTPGPLTVQPAARLHLLHQLLHHRDPHLAAIVG